MSQIQQVHWELEMDYIGHPYYVSGNAILSSLVHEMPENTCRHLTASHGMFVPGQFGTFPDEHSQNGFRPYLGSGLPTVESYDDLFLMRNPSQMWLLDSRPREALNTHDIRTQSGQPAIAHDIIMGRPDDASKRHQTTKWYIHAYLSADRDDILPLDNSWLDGLQFGGKRNYGYGHTRLKATQLVDIEALDYSRLENATEHLLVLVTPFVISSTYPDAMSRGIPWWWDVTRDTVREREERLVKQGDVYRLQTVDHGQVVRYDGNRPVETAQNGIFRVGSHSKYGFGEFRVIPIDHQTEVTQERKTSVSARSN